MTYQITDDDYDTCKSPTEHEQPCFCKEREAETRGAGSVVHGPEGHQCYHCGMVGRHAADCEWNVSTHPDGRVNSCSCKDYLAPHPPHKIESATDPRPYMVKRSAWEATKRPWLLVTDCDAVVARFKYKANADAEAERRNKRV